MSTGFTGVRGYVGVREWAWMALLGQHADDAAPPSIRRHAQHHGGSLPGQPI